MLNAAIHLRRSKAHFRRFIAYTSANGLAIRLAIMATHPVGFKGRLHNKTPSTDTSHKKARKKATMAARILSGIAGVFIGT
jgi:hypothetical protein